MGACICVPIHMALARSWVTRITANHDGGMDELGLQRWSLEPGKASLKTIKAAFCKLTLDNSYPRIRLQQWRAFATKRCRQLKGCNSRTWCAQLFHELTQEKHGRKLKRRGSPMTRWKSSSSCTAPSSGSLCFMTCGSLMALERFPQQILATFSVICELS